MRYLLFLSNFPFPNSVPHLREKHHVTDAIDACEQHHQPVDADAKAAGWWHADLERADEILVDLLHILARLPLERLDEVGVEIRAFADKISSRLGYNLF